MTHAADDMHSVHTVVNEGNAFVARNNLDGARASWGGLVYGLLRAIAECPNCPGAFRVPLDPDWYRLRCPSCGGLWVHQDAPNKECEPEQLSLGLDARA